MPSSRIRKRREANQRIATCSHTARRVVGCVRSADSNGTIPDIRWLMGSRKRGVAIDPWRHGSAFRGYTLDAVTTSMTINSTAAILLCMYVALAQKQGPISRTLRHGSDDILKEYIARYLHYLPALDAVVTDIHWCQDHLPGGTRFRSAATTSGAGATAVQELAFTFANAIAYVQAALDSASSRYLRPAIVVLLQCPQQPVRGDS